MNLSQLSQTSKKIAPILIAIIVIGALIGLIFIKIRPPKPKPQIIPNTLPTPNIKLPPGINKTQLKNLTFNLGNPSLPQKANVYKIYSYQIDSTLAQTIADTFNFKIPPKTSRISNKLTVLNWSIKDSHESLSITIDYGDVQYQKTPTYVKPDVGVAPLPVITNSQQAAKIAQNFLQTHNLFTNDLLVENIKFLQGVYEPEQVDSIDKADFIQVNFKRQLAGLPVYYQYANLTTTSVIIDKQKSVTKVSYQYHPIQQDAAREFSLISLEQAKQKLTNGEGMIVNFIPGEDDAKSSHEFLSAELTGVEVSYLDDASSGYLQPIYIFKGKGNYKDIAPQDIFIYVLAINQP